MDLLLIPGAIIIYSLYKSMSKTTTLENIFHKYKGTPYKWGGTTINGFDCSGWTQYVYKNYFGLNIPRTAAQQAAASSPVEQLKPGDLIFFGLPNNDNITHVGIYYKDNLMIHSGSTNGIEITNFTNSYWSPRFKKFGTFQN